MSRYCSPFTFSFYLFIKLNPFLYVSLLMESSYMSWSAGSDRPRLGSLQLEPWGSRLARARLRGVGAHLLPLFLEQTFPFSWTATTRLGERRRRLSRLRPALCRRRAHPPGMPAPSLSLRCARRSTPNPNETILYSDLNPLTIYVAPTNFDFVCKNYWVRPCFEV